MFNKYKNMTSKYTPKLVILNFKKFKHIIHYKLLYKDKNRSCDLNKYLSNYFNNLINIFRFNH